MWDLPGPGIKPVSPELAGGFLTTASPGKSLSTVFLMCLFKYVSQDSREVENCVKVIRKVSVPKRFLLNTVTFENTLSKPLCTFSFLSLEFLISAWPNLAHPFLKVHLK